MEIFEKRRINSVEDYYSCSEGCVIFKPVNRRARPTATNEREHISEPKNRLHTIPLMEPRSLYPSLLPPFAFVFGTANMGGIDTNPLTYVA